MCQILYRYIICLRILLNNEIASEHSNCLKPDPLQVYEKVNKLHNL